MASGSIMFKIRGGKVVPKCTLDITSTVRQLKMAIKDQINVEVHSQTLTYRGTVLEDGETLDSYGINVDRAHVNVKLKVTDRKAPCVVTVVHTSSKGKTTEKKFSVKGSFTVEKLQEMVADKFPKDVQQSTLVQLATHGRVMDRREELHRYYVVEGSILLAAEDFRFVYGQGDGDSTDWEQEEVEEEEREREKEEEEEASSSSSEN